MKPRLVLFAILISSLAAFSQSSSSVKGSVQDSTGGAVPDVECILSSPATGLAYRATTAVTGDFVFPIVEAGRYNLSLSRSGFQTKQYSNIVITASEVRSLGALTLQVGEVSQSVEVTADVVDIQTSSGEKSDLITGQQMNNIAVRGRDFYSVLSTLPGILDTADRREVMSTRASNQISINGLRPDQKNVQIDGVTEQDVGDNNAMVFPPNMDAIAEVKVLTSGYPAEFGRSAGGVIQVVTKSGTKDLHGTGYSFYRHESLNANDFYNNRSGTPKSIYRYRISGYTLGGPVFIPNKFNTNKDKLFFFWSQEYVGAKVPYGSRSTWMPTELERKGDFSQSSNVNGTRINVVDPTTRQPFAGNVIPYSRFSKYGESILNYLPLPNFVDPDPNNKYRWNYRVNGAYPYPKREDIIRLDYHLTPTLQLTYRYGHLNDRVTGWWGLNGSGAANFDYPASGIEWRGPGYGQMVRLTKTFSPTLVNQLTVGRNTYEIRYNPIDPQEIDRSRMANIPQWYPNNPANTWHGRGEENYLPNITFGSTPANTANIGLHNNLPYVSQSAINSVTESLSKVWRSHSFKFGAYVERTHKNHIGSHNSNYRGSFDFGRNTNNPFDANHGYANALLGNFNTYSESTQRIPSLMRFWIVEYYVQDNWKVSKRLTLDIGVRFSHQPTTSDSNDALGLFDPALYQAANAPAMYTPGRNASGTRVAVNPLTGEFAPTAMIGMYVPGSGDPANGWVVAGTKGYPAGLIDFAPVFVAPRFGFGYDLFGDGKTALRGGFGMFVNKPSGNTTFNTNGQPPIAYRPQVYYGNVDTLDQSAGLLAPSASQITLFGDESAPYVMKYNLSVQRRIGTLKLDIGYVGNLTRHQANRVQVNPMPMFARFDPANEDPTQPGRPLPDNFLRPYFGHGDIRQTTFSGSTNYNALQVSVNRRYTNNFEFGVAYTFGKALGTSSNDDTTISAYFPARNWNYGPLSLSRTHSLAINYIYDLPNVGSRMGVRPAKWVFDNWQLSGMTNFRSGAPFTPGFTTTDGSDIAGSSESARIVAVCDAKLSPGERSYGRNFKTECFQRPAKYTFGNAGPGLLWGPGISNWDMSVSKRIPLWGESRYIRFRAEMFNVWNHTQFSSFDTDALFDSSGRQTDANFGAFASARAPRTMQFSLKVVF